MNNEIVLFETEDKWRRKAICIFCKLQILISQLRVIRCML